MEILSTEAWITSYSAPSPPPLLPSRSLYFQETQLCQFNCDNLCGFGYSHKPIFIASSSMWLQQQPSYSLTRGTFSKITKVCAIREVQFARSDHSSSAAVGQVSKVQTFHCCWQFTNLLGLPTQHKGSYVPNPVILKICSLLSVKS